jgi:hypothetical protein
MDDLWGENILQIGTFTGYIPLAFDEFGFWRDYIFTTDDRRIDWNEGVGTNKLRPTPPINITVESGSAILNWATSSRDLNQFVIQKSTDGTIYYDYVTLTSSI